MIRALRVALFSRQAVAVAFSLVIATATVGASGSDPAEALLAMLAGAVGDVPGAFRASIEARTPVVPNEALRTLAKATPLLLSGVAVALALRAGLFNVGAEGQLLVGAFAAAHAGASWTALPAGLHLVAAIAAGACAGAAWAGIAGLLKAWRGAHEVIVTIMLNYIAIQLTHYLVNGPARDPSSLAPATRLVVPGARLWAIEGGANFSAGFVLALALTVAYGLLLRRTRLGFEIRATGLNPAAARSGGVPVPRTIVIAMALSGALAGLAGAVEVLGVHRRFLDAFSPGYGFDSIAVALLGDLSPAGILASAILFGGLGSGALSMEAFTGTPRQIAGIVQAVVILAVAVRSVSFLRNRRARREAQA